jgi:hypothetical protein
MKVLRLAADELDGARAGSVEEAVGEVGRLDGVRD